MDQETELVAVKAQVTLLAKAIHNMSVSVGICKEDVSLTGPEVLALAADLSIELRRLASVEAELATYKTDHANTLEALLKAMDKNAELEAELVALREQKPIYPSENLSYSHEGMGCGLEDRGITDRYEAMQYGWNEAVESIDRAGPFFAAPVPTAEPFGNSEPLPLAIEKAEMVDDLAELLACKWFAVYSRVAEVC